MRLASSLAAAALLRHAPLSVLRVGVHPPDVHHPAIVRSIARTLEVASASRRCAGYRDLLVAYLELDHECNGGFLRTGWSVADPEALAFFAPVHVRESHPDHRIWSEIPMGKHALN